MSGVNHYVGPVLTNCPWVFDNRCGVVKLMERGIQRYNVSFPSIKKLLMIGICETYITRKTSFAKPGQNL